MTAWDGRADTGSQYCMPCHAAAAEILMRIMSTRYHFVQVAFFLTVLFTLPTVYLTDGQCPVACCCLQQSNAP